MTGERVLLVGESNPYGDNDSCALLPWTVNAAGDRLRRIFGLTEREYLAAFDRTNLLRSGAKWSPAAARGAASALMHKRRILLGSRVAAAHGVSFKPFRRFYGDGLVWSFVKTAAPLDVLVLPHPSGRCRIWNDRGAASKARRALKKFLDT